MTTNPELSKTRGRKIVVSAEEVQRRVPELAAQISADYADREIDLVCLTHSAMMFTADLVRRVTVPVRQHALAFSSYPQSPASGEVRLIFDIAEPLQGRHVLLTEGMVISGRTPPVSVESAALAPARKPGALRHR